MEIKKKVNDMDAAKVTGGADIEYEVVGEPYEIICPDCGHVFDRREWKERGPIIVHVDDMYCPDCKRTVSPIANKLYAK